MPPKRKAATATRAKSTRAKTSASATPASSSNDSAWGEVQVDGFDTPPVFYRNGPPGSSKIASFDMDSTLIKTKSGKTFATGSSDWMWLYPEVPTKLKALHKEGKKIVIFTNQAGIEKGNTSVAGLKTKMEAMIADLGIPIQIFISSGSNHCRKPATKMWDLLCEDFNDGVEVDLEESFYCGDAAGRPAGWKAGLKKDFSCGDRMFAANIGIAFHTPEAFFLGEKEATFSWDAIDPAEAIANGLKKKATRKSSYHKTTQEMVICVGRPASGKSTFSKKYFVSNGYVHVNQDTCKTKAACHKAAKAALSAGSSVVIDNTNPSKDARQDYIKMAKASKVPVRCFYFDTPVELATHMNMVRTNITEGATRRVPMVAYNMFNKNFAKPTTSEGFTEVNTIEFVPQFDTPEDERLFRQWSHMGR